VSAGYEVKACAHVSRGSQNSPEAGMDHATSSDARATGADVEKAALLVGTRAACSTRRWQILRVGAKGENESCSCSSRRRAAA